MRKDEILLHCLSGDERNHHIQKMLMDSLWNLIHRLNNFGTLQSRQLEETIIKLFFEDDNYLDFHVLLFQCLKSQAYYLTQEKLYDEAVNIMERALYHAREYDKIYAEKDKIFKYTTAMFDMLECDTAKIMRSGTGTFIDEFYEWLENKFYDPLRERDDFKKLAENK